MQPPRPRRRRERPTDAQILIAIVLNAGAVLLAALLLGIVLRLAGTSPSRGLAHLSRTIDILTRPFAGVPWLSGTPSLVLITVVVALLWVALLGVLRGWEAEGRDHPRFSHLRRP